MALNVSTATAPHVAVCCDKPVYYSGELVQGHVIFNAAHAFGARSVCVEVTGTETISWQDGSKQAECKKDGEGYREGRNTPMRRAEHAFMKAAVPLYEWEGEQPVIPAGQYQFPFRFTLPYGPPGSFRFRAGAEQQPQQPPRLGGRKGSSSGKGSSGGHLSHGDTLVTAEVCYMVTAQVELLQGPGDNTIAHGSSGANHARNHSSGSSNCSPHSNSNSGSSNADANVEVIGCPNAGSNINSNPAPSAGHLHASTEITVRQQPSMAAAQQPPVAETLTRVRQCGGCLPAWLGLGLGCWAHGGVQLRVRSSRAAYEAGQTVEVVVEVENRTDVAFPELHLSLERRMQLRAAGGGAGAGAAAAAGNSCSYERRERVCKLKFPGLVPGSSYQGANALLLRLPLPPALPPSCHWEGEDEDEEEEEDRRRHRSSGNSRRAHQPRHHQYQRYYPSQGEWSAADGSRSGRTPQPHGETSHPTSHSARNTPGAGCPRRHGSGAGASPPTLLHCSYRLWVELAGGGFTDSLRLHLPLTIHAPLQQPQPQPQPQPQQLTVASSVAAAAAVPAAAAVRLVAPVAELPLPPPTRMAPPQPHA